MGIGRGRGIEEWKWYQYNVTLKILNWRWVEGQHRLYNWTLKLNRRDLLKKVKLERKSKLKIFI